jgi:succinoglycan biosynthesis transport protein ExoP
MKRWWWLFPVLALVGLFAGVIVAGVITYVQPKTFDSQAVVEIKPPGQMIVSAGSTMPPPVERDPKFLEREMAVIKSQGVLLAAVKQLDFDRKWAVPAVDAAAIVGRSITLEQLKGTDLVTIRARHVNREDARDMVVAVIDEYRKQRISRDAGKSEGAMKALSEAVQEQEDKVEERRKALAGLVRTRTLLHQNEGAGPPPQGGTGAVDNEEYIARKREFEEEQALLESLKLKYVTEKVSANLDQDELVIHEDPQLPLAPSGPDVTGNMGMGLMSGLAVSQVLALLLVLLLPSRRPEEMPPPLRGA